MQAAELAQRLKNHFSGCQVMVTDQTGSGNHFDVSIIATQFKGKSPIERHRSVMAVFDKEIKSGEIHALSIKTYESEA